MTDRISADIWARARAAYLEGEPAATVCARFGISRSAFFAAAQAGGWRRLDQTAAGAGEDTTPPPTDALPAVDLAETAMARASAAVMAGRLNEARGWTRLVAELRDLAVQESGRNTWPEALGRAVDEEARGRHAADRLVETAIQPDCPDSRRTQVSSASNGFNKIISSAPDSVDCPRRAGLLASAAMPEAFDDRMAWAEAAIAKLEQQDKTTGRRAMTGGP